MAVSPIDLARERTRQEIAQDSDFFKKFIYFFELRVPDYLALDVAGQFLFPLALNPEDYEMQEPFTLEATPTQGGGLYVEENGIVQRMIHLSGTTGFKPRPLLNTSVTALSALKSEKRSFSRSLPEIVLANISGQRHFQYLQDAVFRTYADLKRDPATAEDTSLIFHNPRDQEHWLVAPESFNLDRSKTQPTLYRYDIKLLVIDKAEEVDADFSEDKPLMDKIKDKLRMVKSGLDLAAGALNDITAIASEIEGLVKNLSTIIDGVGTVIDAASNFVDGAVSLIESPYALLESTNGVIESAGRAWETLEQAKEDIQNLPDNIKQKFKQMEDGLDRIGTHPSAFEKPTERKLRENKQRQELRLATSSAALSIAEATPPPTTLSANAKLGTGITQGDALSAESELGAGRDLFNFTGARAVSLGQGDTLVNLSARYLGDARLWQHIATLNGLKPPFLTEIASADLTADESPLVGAIGVGDTILIPTFAKAPADLPVLPVLGVQFEEPVEHHLLGTDLALEMVSGREGAPLYDIPIDFEAGATDAKTVSGIDNIKQAIILRLRTEKGSDTLYKRVGLGRIIGFNIVPVDLEQARFRFIEALTQDSRVAAVRRIEFGNEDDALIVDVDVELRGFTETNNVQTRL
jgi:hypothetical protein